MWPSTNTKKNDRTRQESPQKKQHTRSFCLRSHEHNSHRTPVVSYIYKRRQGITHHYNCDFMRNCNTSAEYRAQQADAPWRFVLSTFGGSVWRGRTMKLKKQRTVMKSAWKKTSHLFGDKRHPKHARLHQKCLQERKTNTYVKRIVFFWSANIFCFYDFRLKNRSAKGFWLNPPRHKTPRRVDYQTIIGTTASNMVCDLGSANSRACWQDPAAIKWDVTTHSHKKTPQRVKAFDRLRLIVGGCFGTEP